MGAPTAVQEVRGSRQEPSIRARPTLWVALGACAAVGMVLTGTRIGAVPDPRLARWWFSLPAGGRPFESVGFYLSLGLFLVAWFGLGTTARTGALSVRRAWSVLALWGTPFLLGPPLFSRDLFSYVAQGIVAHRGLSPYAASPSVLGPGPLLSGVASVWRHTTSPYGPFVVASSKVVAALGGSLDGQLIAYRVLELAGVVLIMVSLPRLARHLGTDPGVALWLGALSPLALFSFVASGHNDALMTGLVVAGVTLAVTGGFLPGLALCALAATVKLPAALAVAFLAADRMARLRSNSSRWWVASQAVAVLGGAFVVVTAVAGYGWAWIGPTALHIPTELRVLSTPSVSLGVLVFSVLHPLGIPVARSAVVTVTQDLVAVAAVAAVIWLLVTAGRRDVVRSLGLALLLIVVGSPTVWPWYLMWGLVLLAATSAQQSRLLVATAGLAMLVVGPSGHPLLLGDWFLVVSVASVAGAVWLVRDGHWRQVVGDRDA